MRTKIDTLIRSPLFVNPKHKAVVTMLFIGNLLKYEINDLTRKKAGLTIQQYNALRILRINHKENQPMKVSDVKNRMTFKDSDVSRLLRRLFNSGLINIYTDKKDKRIQWCLLNEKGLAILNEIDKHEDELFRAASLMTVEETEQLNLLFDKVLQAYNF